MRRAGFLFLVLTALGWGDTVFVSGAPNRALSRSFLPSEFHVSNAGAGSRLHAYFQRQPRDSGLDYSLKGNTLRLSARMQRRLAPDSGTGTGNPRLDFRRKLEGRLKEIAGPGVSEEAVYSVEDYFPNDIALQSPPQWGLSNNGSLTGGVAGLDIGMPRVWEQFDGGDSLIIAVLDAGINFLHPDLQGRWFVNSAEAQGLPGVDDDGNGFVDDSTGWDFVDDDNRPQDTHGHGSYTSGVIAAGFDNGIGIAGMLPRVRILPVRVLATTGEGYSGNIADGIRYAAKMGAVAINFSIGVGSAGLDTVLRNGFIAARDSGVLVAAAAGNETRNLDAEPRDPSTYKFDNIYMVASHGPGGALSGFSNYGATTVDLGAPGEQVRTTSIPAPLTLLSEGFEAFTGKNWALSSGFAVAPDSMVGAKSLKWSSGNTATAVLDSIDLRGKHGGTVSFMLQFRQARASDWFDVEVQRVGSASWTTIATVNANVAGETLIFSIGEVDNRLFRLRLRPDYLVSSGTRVLRIDDLKIQYSDENPANQDRYASVSGTSLAAPYVAGYAGLMRLACRRAGLPVTRARMLAGTVPDSFLVGKTITGGRLDVAKGLDFYLRSLPSLAVANTADSLWGNGDPVHYSLSVRDTAQAPVTGYTFALNPGTVGSLAGNAFTQSSPLPGADTARFRAEKPPLVLRKMLRFVVFSGTPVAPAYAGASVLRIGNRKFQLPSAAFRGSHVLRLEFFGADGRAQRVLTGELSLPPGARSAEYRVSGVSGVGLRAWLDGAPLKPSL